MRIILLGPAGSGKGTQGELIERHYGFPRISTGDLLRLEVKKGTELGRMVEAIMKSGQLVADELVLEVVKARLQSPDCRSGYVLDGYPRTLNQALLLEQLDPSRPETVLEIQISEDAVLKRLAGRLVCSQCGAVYNVNNKESGTNLQCQVCGGNLAVRSDDRPEVIKERYRIYRETSGLLLEHYSRKQVLFQVDGDRTVEEVFEAIKLVLDSQISGQRGESSRP
ncbi:MAG: adenylate kinase [Candidatus Saccharicenans sp.]|uniref:adenylate kinase n=1 Tax=Candidatus Saccharicenans sp. TaxID=2819258 RepID=UPI00404AE5FC